MSMLLQGFADEMVKLSYLKGYASFPKGHPLRERWDAWSPEEREAHHVRNREFVSRMAAQGIKVASEKQSPVAAGAKRMAGIGLGFGAGYGGAGLLYGAIKGEPGASKAWRALNPTKRFRLAQIALAGGGGGALLANALRDKARREGR